MAAARRRKRAGEVLVFAAPAEEQQADGQDQNPVPDAQ